MSRTWPCFVFRRPRSRSFFLLVEYEFKFTTRLLHCQISGVQSDGAVPQKAELSRVPFQSSGIRVNNEPKSSTSYPRLREGNISPLSPNPIRFYGLSIDPSIVWSVGRPTSLLSTEPIDHKSGIGVRSPFPLPQFVFGPFGKRLPESCKYDGAPFDVSCSRTRVNGALGID